MLDDEVDGVVTTGYHCGHRASASSKIREDVPLLVLIGSEDTYIPGPVRRTASGTIQKLCDRVLKKSPMWKYLVVEGAPHRVPIRRAEVRAAVLELLRTVGS